jgi:hypothetical protein
MSLILAALRTPTILSFSASVLSAEEEFGGWSEVGEADSADPARTTATHGRATMAMNLGGRRKNSKRVS